MINFLTNLRYYFDLNKRLANSLSVGIRSVRMSNLEDESNKSNPKEDLISKNKVNIVNMKLWEQLLLYFGTFLGVLFSSSISELNDKIAVADIDISVESIFISAIVSLVIIPFVFEKLKLNPDTPLIFRLGLFVQHGVFWHVLINAIGNIIVK